jgi:hypothetical protein
LDFSVTCFNFVVVSCGVKYPARLSKTLNARVQIKVIDTPAAPYISCYSLDKFKPPAKLDYRASCRNRVGGKYFLATENRLAFRSQLKRSEAEPSEPLAEESQPVLCGGGCKKMLDGTHKTSPFGSLAR